MRRGWAGKIWAFLDCPRFSGWQAAATANRPNGFPFPTCQTFDQCLHTATIGTNPPPTILIPILD